MTLEASYRADSVSDALHNILLDLTEWGIAWIKILKINLHTQKTVIEYKNRKTKNNNNKNKWSLTKIDKS